MSRPFPPALAAVLLAPLACGGPVDPESLVREKPALHVTLSSKPLAGAPTALPPDETHLDLSSTFAFDHACGVLASGLHVSARADAAPALTLDLEQWAANGQNRFQAACTGEGAGCAAELARVRWDAEGGRFDAQPGRPSDGLPGATSCSAAVVADGILKTEVIIEGGCENLLGTFSRPGESPVFGPVRLSFRALCQRP
jgi:hypothetical protein